MRKFETGFTLAEVLITLMIIGVVAAMTIPSLLQSYKKIEYGSKLKKFYSTMTGAIKMIEFEEGIDVKGWNFNLSSEEFFQRYFAKHMSYVRAENRTIEDEYHPDRYFVYFSDGTSASFAINPKYYLMCFDINGDKAPNKNGQDQFYYTICNSSDNDEYFTCATGRQGITFGVMQDINMDSRNTLRDDCKDFVYTCSWLVLQDGWQFKDDYPHPIP